MAAKSLAYMPAAVHIDADQWIALAVVQGQPIVEDDLEVVAWNIAKQIEGLAMALHAHLVCSTADHLLQLVHSHLGGRRVGNTENVDGNARAMDARHQKGDV